MNSIDQASLIRLSTVSAAGVSHTSLLRGLIRRFSSNSQVHWPWGLHDSTHAGERFQVKRTLVKPRASLNLRKHYDHAAHWIVVKGTAGVICGKKKLLQTENQSTCIPLGEDDILRLEDIYGR